MECFQSWCYQKMAARFSIQSLDDKAARGKLTLQRREPDPNL